MGTWSTALFSDDVACDVRDEFVELLSRRVSPAEATAALLRSWSSDIDDEDDGPTFWLALAATQWKYGCLADEVRDRAMEVVESGCDISKWGGASAARRKAVLLALKQQLLSPQPAPRQPRRRKALVVPSIKVLSPDGRGLATAFELAASTDPDGPCMQVMVELLVGESRGGSGVFVADCEFDKVSLDWLDAEALQISYPASATVGSRQTSLFYFGRIIQITYRTTGA